jgi:ribosomal protein S18 acetylase RimI-like enzyme
MKRVTPGVATSILRDIGKTGMVKKGFGVRLAKPADIPALLDTGRACFAYNPPTRRELRYALTRAHAMVVILFHEKTGAFVGFDIYEFNARNDAMYLNLTCLKPEWRGKGLSHSLLKVCHEVARKAGCRSIRSHVAKGNEAMIHLLESYGHIRGEIHPHYYSDNKTAMTYRHFLDKATAR